MPTSGAGRPVILSRRGRARTAGGLCVLLLVTACGSSGEEPVAAPSPSPSASPSLAPSPSPAETTAPSPASDASMSDTVLTGNGIEASRGLVEFGTGFEEAAAALQKSLGEPTADSGLQTDFDLSGCTGPRLRALEYADGAVEVLFRSDSDEPLMIGWRLSGQGPQVPRASAFVGDVTTYEFGVGTTVQDMREGAGEAFEAIAAQDSFGPQFAVMDQSPGFGGQLSGTTDADTVTLVQAGESCGE